MYIVHKVKVKINAVATLTLCTIYKGQWLYRIWENLQMRLHKILDRPYFCLVVPLNSFQREQILPATSAFLPVFQLFHVECECQQEKLRLYTPFSPDQKPSEIVVLLQYPEHAFHLYGSVLPKKNTFIGQNIRKRFLSVFHKLWRNPDLPKSSFGVVTLPVMRTAFTALVPIISRFHLIP